MGDQNYFLVLGLFGCFVLFCFILLFFYMMFPFCGRLVASNLNIKVKSGAGKQGQRLNFLDD